MGPSVLRALSAELRRLEHLPAARAPLDPDQAVDLYPLISDARDALTRLANGLEQVADPSVPESGLGLALRQFRQAEQDMKEAVEAADCLAAREGCRALETGMVVAYVRAFGSSNKIGALDPEWEPENERGKSLHDVLITLRDKRYAHSDRGMGRKLRALPWGDVTAYEEETRGLDPAVCAEIAELCRRQAGRFREAGDKIEAQLNDEQQGSA